MWQQLNGKNLFSRVLICGGHVKILINIGFTCQLLIFISFHFQNVIITFHNQSMKYTRVLKVIQVVFKIIHNCRITFSGVCSEIFVSWSLTRYPTCCSTASLSDGLRAQNLSRSKSLVHSFCMTSCITAIEHCVKQLLHSGVSIYHHGLTNELLF